MSETKEMTCVVCPNSCRLKVTYKGKEVLEVYNALCKKGKEYAVNEMLNPVRSLTTTVKVIGGILPLVSVRSDKPIPKELVVEAVKIVRKMELKAPVKYHQVILENILDSGANIIATREVEKLIECS